MYLKLSPRARALLRLPPTMESEEEECPLCVEVLTAEDLKFEPCPCGYQVRAGGGHCSLRARERERRAALRRRAASSESTPRPFFLF